MLIVVKMINLKVNATFYIRTYKSIISFTGTCN